MILQRASQLAPLIQGFTSPGPGSIGPDVFELFLIVFKGSRIEVPRPILGIPAPPGRLHSRLYSVFHAVALSLDDHGFSVVQQPVGENKGSDIWI